jgi:subtilase family serine protease
LIYELPGNFPGRNLPDVSFNADPYTGYVVYYTSSVSGFGVEPGWGGTSFVAPQLNGVTALLGEDLHGHRIGLLNFPLYFLAITGQAYSGSNPPLNVIEYGDNWFYQARDGYSPAAGLGTLNVANFADAFQHLLF